jgi:superfamily II DNA helicase RecQ
MELHFFAIPALAPRPAQDELNRFVAAHRIASVERRFVDAGAESYWAVCLTVASGPGPLPDRLTASRGRGAGKVDYREVLSTADFAVYARLRALRKEHAARDGVPVYAVFTNEQLAAIVRERVDTLEALGRIDGVGPARIERYGAAFLEALAAARGAKT